MSTIIDVANKASVSVVTVSRLLNNPEIVSKKTALKIQNVMEELNYQPNQVARSLVNRRTNTIGVIMPDIKNTFFNNWFRFIEDYARKHDYNLLLCNTDENSEIEFKYVKLLQSQRVDGIIIVPSSDKSVDYLKKSNIHFVLMDRLIEKYNTNYVTTDHYQGAYDATNYLLNLGHKNIAVFKGAGVLYPDIQRMLGFKDCMETNNIKINYSNIFNCEFKEEKAYKVVTQLFGKKEKPTAIFAFNSLMSIGVIKAMQSMKLKIGKDISLLSYDEIPGYDIFQPRITCVKQPIDMLGKNVIVGLIETINNPNTLTRQKSVLKPKLILGESCSKV